MRSAIGLWHARHFAESTPLTGRWHFWQLALPSSGEWAFDRGPGGAGAGTCAEAVAAAANHRPTAAAADAIRSTAPGEWFDIGPPEQKR
jgi:hypothetical protein